MYLDSFTVLRNITFILATLMLVKYLVFLVFAAFYPVVEKLRRLRILHNRKTRKKPYMPLISVIVPAWNEEVGIIRTVDSLLTNTYDNIEIIVVSDGSTDNTDTVMAQYIAKETVLKDKNVYRLRYFTKERGGKGRALNFGINQANGEIIVTMDADSVFDVKAIQNLVNYFEDPTINAVVGNVRVAENKTLVGLIQKLEYYFGFYFKRAHSVMGAEYVFGGACTAFRKANTFDKYGLFDTINKTEDIEMSMRLRTHGVKCTYAENVICYTEGATTLTGLINQRLRWKKGRLDTFIKYRSLFFSRRKEHNKFLTWFVLPYSLIGEIQLFFEPIAISLLIAYSYIAGDYFSLVFGSLFMFTIYYINAIFNTNIKIFDRILLIPLFFFTWGLFYLLVWVEYLALFKGLAMVVKGDDVVWQSWQRKGVAA